MEFKKENFNGFFKVTLDTVLASDLPNCTDEKKIGYYKTIVSEFHYFVYFTLLKKAIKDGTYTKKSLQILGPLFEKVKDRKFEVKVGRDKYEVSLETVCNFIIVNAKDTLNKLEGVVEGTTAIDFQQFFAFFVSKNFQAADQAFTIAVTTWAEAVLVNPDAGQHIENILQAFKDSEEKKLFHNETDSRGFNGYTAIGDSVQKQSIGTNAGWMERFKWIIDAFSSQLATASPAQNHPKQPQATSSVSTEKPEFKIFVGPPGCGKTREVKNLVKRNNQTHFFIQIHPSYGYEDLVEGLKPLNFPDGEVRYDIVEGPLRIMEHMAGNRATKVLCLIRKRDSGFQISLPIGTTNRFEFKKVQLLDSPFSGIVDLPELEIISDEIFLPNDFANNKVKSIAEKVKSENKFIAHLYLKDTQWGNSQYALILDELNRGNVPQLLGELIYLLGEADADFTIPVKLQYSQDEMTWPRALSLYATMNSADVSTDRLDQAIKRRFSMTHIGPNEKIFLEGPDSFDFLASVNQRGISVMSEFKPISSLNEFFKFCGAESNPETILSEINEKIIIDAASFGVSHPHEKLLGHSYFLKICRRTADILSGKESTDLKSAILFFETLEVIKEEVIPALASILNADEMELNRFLIEIASIKEKVFSAYKLSDIEKFVERIIFKQAAKVTSLNEYKDLRKTKWPNAA